MKKISILVFLIIPFLTIGNCGIVDGVIDDNSPERPEAPDPLELATEAILAPGTEFQIGPVNATTVDNDDTDGKSESTGLNLGGDDANAQHIVFGTLSIKSGKSAVRADTSVELSFTLDPDFSSASSVEFFLVLEIVDGDVEYSLTDANGDDAFFIVDDNDDPTEIYGLGDTDGATGASAANLAGFDPAISI